MGRWQTVTTGVRLQVEPRLELALVTLNVHVSFYSISLQQQDASSQVSAHGLRLRMPDISL